MANEFIHIDPGAILTKAEFELITGHQFNSQATGDILYASDSTQLSRLGIGSNTNVLEITGGLPAWIATSGTGSVARVTSPTFVTPALGTPASGVMTNVSGTASSLTAGNVTTNANLTGHVTSSGNAAVLGSFSSAQLKTALSDETGSGDAVFATSPVLVTPALGTPASGVLTNATGLPEAGLAVSNSPTNGYMLTAQSGDAGGMTWAAASSGLDAASQAEMEAASSNTVAVTPGRTQNHPGVAKAWIKYNAGTDSIYVSHNVTGIADEGTGDFTITIATDFSGINYVVNGTCSNNCYIHQDAATPTAGTVRVQARSDSGTATNTTHTYIAMFGDQ